MSPHFWVVVGGCWAFLGGLGGGLVGVFVSGWLRRKQ